MQRDLMAFAGNPNFAYGHEADECMESTRLGGQMRSPLGVFEFQASKVCPRNFIIFDQTDDKGCVMYHPALANKLNPTNIDVSLDDGKAVCRSSGHDTGNLEECSSSFKEDTKEIDALLSSGEENDEDDVVSTGRTPFSKECCPFDSSLSPRSKKMRHSAGKSSVFHGSMEHVTHENIRNLITVLRGVIPGGGQLDTPAVLEEAIRYLKFLKMEAKKLGMEGFG